MSIDARRTKISGKMGHPGMVGNVASDGGEVMACVHDQ
jgi:hypothetical protein